MRDIILAGIQWSGKGTQAQLLLEEFWNQIQYFETGNILRALMSNENAIGQYLKELVNGGRLVKDEVVVWLFKVFLETLDNKSVLWDGSLRRVGQTKGILDALLEKGRKPIVIQLEIPEEEVYKRLSHRKMCKNCGKIHSTLLSPEIQQCQKCWWELYVRADDADIAAVETRIAEYKKETIPALDYVNELWLLVKIDGMQSAEAIYAKIKELILN